MQPPTVPFPVAPVQNALRALLDVEVERLRRAGVCEFRWIPEEEPGDVDLAELELDEEDDAVPDPPPDTPPPVVVACAGPRHVQPGTPDEKRHAAERIEALRKTYPDLALADALKRVGAETGRSTSALRRWHREVMGIEAVPGVPSSPEERAAVVTRVEALLRAHPKMCREDAYRRVAASTGRPSHTVAKWYIRSLRGTL
jgi:hypothetical protein